jgi:hypothetical protein
MLSFSQPFVPCHRPLMADTNEHEGMGKMSHTIIVYGRVVKENRKIGEMNGAAGNKSTSLGTVVKISGENTGMLDAGPRAPAPRSIFPFYFLTHFSFYMNRPN